MRFGIIRLLCAAAIGSSGAGLAAEPLVNPFKRPPAAVAAPLGETGKASSAGGGCPAPVTPVQGIEGVTYYKRGTGSSVVDPELQRQNIAIVQPANDFTVQVAAATRRYLASGRRDNAAASCALQLLDGWASANAFSGSFNVQGLGHRRWVVNSLAVDYLAIATAPNLDPAAQARVTAWLDRQGSAIIASIGDVANNHLYWGAAAVMATAIAADNKANFQWAVDAASRGLSSIARDGTLPLELRRGQRALNYHAFALEPLVQIAGFAQANGVSLYAVNDGALKRLVDFVLANASDSTNAAKLAGAPQLWDGATVDTLSWAEQYYADTGDCAVAPYLRRLRPLKKGYLGGDTTQLYGGSRPNRCN